MKILIACEFSGVVRDAFRKLGHDAWSCDLLDTEQEGPHMKRDVIEVLDENWDMIIAHPPCTYLASSGARWWSDRMVEQRRALLFVKILMNCGIPKIAIENPIGKISSAIRKPDQIIQPYEYGHPSRKTTCLWLKGLPLLKPTNIVEPDIYTCKNGKTFSRDYMVTLRAGSSRGKERSRTYPGIAEAMAEQWGGRCDDQY